LISYNSEGAVSFYDAYDMPVFLRNYYLKKLLETKNKESQAEDKAANPTNIKKSIGKIKPGW